MVGEHFAVDAAAADRPAVATAAAAARPRIAAPATSSRFERSVRIGASFP
jgi:hypothetical protein